MKTALASDSSVYDASQGSTGATSTERRSSRQKKDRERRIGRKHKTTGRESGQERWTEISNWTGRKKGTAGQRDTLIFKAGDHLQPPGFRRRIITGLISYTSLHLRRLSLVVKISDITPDLKGKGFCRFHRRHWRALITVFTRPLIWS